MDEALRREAINRINEMERWLREEVHKAIVDATDCQLLNPLSRYRNVQEDERLRRSAFRTDEASRKILDIVHAMMKNLRPTIS